MKLVLVVAVAKNGVIGRDGDLPWRLPADLAHFKRVTRGHPLIMGRKTWDSIGRRPLKGRPAIVVSSDPSCGEGRAQVVESVPAAIEAARAFGADTACVAGGGGVYRACFPLADRVELTWVEAEVEGDAFFPLELLEGWTLVAEERRPADAKHPYAFAFRTYARAPREPAAPAGADPG